MDTTLEKGQRTFLRPMKAYLAMAAIFTLELTALIQGVDGKCLALACAAIAALGGYSLRGFFK